MPDPDGLERLYTPHRMAYLKGESKPASDGEHECPFCLAPGLPPEQGLVVARGTLVYAVMNLYPYNTGHLMICPYRHVADYTDLGADEVAELGAFTQRAMAVLRAASNPHGFNLGMNQGVVGGAGRATRTSCRWWGAPRCCPSC
jgi:ATP adenylyltransferase